jgi:hypothetical protein
LLLANARLYLPPQGTRLEQTLEAIDRAIRLDSSFLPALMGYEPVELALRMDDPGRAHRYLRAKADGKARPDEVDGYRFASLMLERPGKGYRMLDAWADTAGIKAVVAAVDVLAWWPDSGETAARLARALMRRSHAADSADSGLWPGPVWRTSSAIALLLRGRLHDAWLVHPLFASRRAGVFAMLPAESVAATNLRADPVDFPRWAVRGDTIALRRYRARLDSLARVASGVPHATVRFIGTSATRDRRLAAYDRDRADAYLALARRDTSEAIARFTRLIDSACPGCSWTRLFTDIYSAALLLEARGRGPEAQRWLE